MRDIRTQRKVEREFYEREALRRKKQKQNKEPDIVVKLKDGTVRSYEVKTSTRRNRP